MDQQQPLSPLDRAIAAAGGPLEMSRKLGFSSPSSITNWRRRNGKVPAEHVGPVSRISGIPPHELRPDLFAAPAQAA